MRSRTHILDNDSGTGDTSSADQLVETEGWLGDRRREEPLDWTTGLDHWTGPLDWTAGLDHWTGPLDWTTGLDRWTGPLDWTTGLDHWTGPLDWTTGVLCGAGIKMIQVRKGVKVLRVVPHLLERSSWL
ncbi:hypothetical protein DPEC_G00338110 [Dallia pectoralis]|uniref:Uncharacterized protein n=1 Tax=Dallia pectoralis TaxID=75939 RepID=A0ACC2F4I2_DALPE|nr:hypothetical protein DPEC_G00338110 [Dallia pectoralis]